MVQPLNIPTTYGDKSIWKLVNCRHLNDAIDTLYSTFRLLQQIVLESDFFFQNTTIFSLIATEHIPKTAIMTTFGAAHVLQQLVDTVYQGLELAFVYINDILVVSEDQ